MDCRDIKEEPKPVKGGMYLEEIYTLQKELVDHYVRIEGLPPYPVDINSKASQILLKDFTGRIIEELAEGYESLTEVENLTEKNGLWAKANSSEKDYQQMLNHLQNANEEQADALHFFVELLIYANIQPEDIKKYIEKVLKENNLYDEGGISNDIIYEAQALGEHVLQNQNIYNAISNKNKVDLLLTYQARILTEIDTRLMIGGSSYHSLTYQDYKFMLWDITCHLNIARNFLKNKPWKQSQMMTNELAYQQKLVESFILMMGYFKSFGYSSWDVYYLYFKKNMVNRFRIDSMY